MKILIVIGTRPNFVKTAPLVEAIKKYNSKKKKRITYKIVHTGQHYDYEMSKLFFQELKIPKPDYNLGVGSGSHGFQTARTMEKIEKVIEKEKPDFVIVLGDVNATLAGALVAAKMHIKIGHIEAGMRSFNKRMPEEINRIVTGHVADYHFCSTKTAVLNLKREGIKENVYNVGDIMYDTFLRAVKFASKNSKILEKLNLKKGNYCLATIHRAENTDEKARLKNIVSAFSKIENLIFPIHPRTKKYLKDYKLWQSLNRKIRIIKPVGYLDMLWLENNAKKILTDSGGVQKEAYFAKVPCLTLRDETEWVETVKGKWNILVGADKDRILKAVERFNPKNTQKKYFGGGDTSKKILEILTKNYAKKA
ncbi:MAG: UDP-N-acetylglucosamine 2-epimerase (non-hydrolyzing) [Candidatus Pacebacteria bacterium]|nr:UDP-N-acetylglucosamine 2-epimerase (non-hydrolyzing) [Candidatus Paceibacterota bacterium]